MKENQEILTTYFILFHRFIKKWNLTLAQMGILVGKYSLVTFISENEDDINEFGVDGAVHVIEEYIRRQGGILTHGAVS